MDEHGTTRSFGRASASDGAGAGGPDYCAGEHTDELTIVTDQPVEIDGVMATPSGTGGMLETIATVGQVAYVHEDTSLDVPGGAIAGGVERGSVTVNVDSGNGFLWPEMMELLGPEGGGDQPPERIDLMGGGTRELTANDGFGFWDAGIDWQVGDDRATILQVRIEPVTAAAPDG